ncbi:MAG: 50S ribosome-binding GTPase [Theionarchaea archaeon]|nr:50S ribosome-binding GTPase [Theionarchaea archaeon]
MFKEIPPYTHEEIIDIAFRKASKKGRNEREKVVLAADTISSLLEKIIKRHPSFEHMNQFQRELIDIMVGEDALRHNLGAIQWAARTVQKLKREYVRRIRNRKDSALTMQKQCFARYVSVIDQVAENLTFLREARLKLITLPSVNQDLFTVVLAGCPNVGKTSVLKALTGSDPDIQSYPFTTQGINVGHMVHGVRKIQVIDTPGLLDRPFQKRNWIEKQAISALRHLADSIVYIFDVSLSCGYSLQEQENLLRELESVFSVPFIIVNNKCDLKRGDHVNISAEKMERIEYLHEHIISLYEHALKSIPQ